MSTATELRLALQPSWLSVLLLALRQRAERRAAERDARRTDARTLHDIGLDRSELSSVSLEVTGLIEATRWRVGI